MNQQLDPALEAAYQSLPDDIRAAALRGDKHAERRLRAAYIAETVRRQHTPNRAARRAAAKQQNRRTR